MQTIHHNGTDGDLVQVEGDEGQIRPKRMWIVRKHIQVYLTRVLEQNDTVGWVRLGVFSTRSVLVAMFSLKVFLG